MKAYVAAVAARYARGLRVLDLGCGVGRDLQRLAAVSRPVGVDVSERALARAKKLGHPVLRADGARLPFKSAAFAGCRVERVLQHVTDPDAVLDEVVRVVCDGGFIAVFEPDFSTFRVESTTVTDGGMPGRFVTARHPSIGSAVAGRLEARGCTVVDVVTETSFAYAVDALPVDPVALLHGGVESGALDRDVATAWLDEQQRRSQQGTFHASWSKILTVALAPGATRPS